MAVNPPNLSPYNLKQVGFGNVDNDKLGIPLRLAWQIINDDLEIISLNLSRIDNSLASTITRMGTAEGDIIQIRNLIQTLQGRIDTTITSLNSLNTSLTADVSSLRASVNSIQAGLIDLSGRLNTVSDRVEEVFNNLSTRALNIETDLDAFKTSTNGSISYLTNEALENVRRVDAISAHLEGRINTVAARAEEILNFLNNRINGISSSNGLSSRVFTQNIASFKVLPRETFQFSIAANGLAFSNVVVASMGNALGAAIFGVGSGSLSSNPYNGALTLSSRVQSASEIRCSVTFNSTLSSGALSNTLYAVTVPASTVRAVVF